MKIGYGKIGRSIPITMADASNVGGDAEVVRLLDRLREHHEVHLIGRNRANVVLDNVVNYWAEGALFDGVPTASRHKDEKFIEYDAFFEERIPKLPELDAVIVWLGQHGSSMHPVPAVQDGKRGTFTNPLLSDVNYGYPLVKMINQRNWRPIWMCPDPRNMIKFRDLWDKDQRPILAQYNTSKDNTFWDERASRMWNGSTRYSYSGIELLALEPTSSPLATLPDRTFGLLVNEGYTNLGVRGRCHLVKTWLANVPDYEIFGTWSDKSQVELGRTIVPVALAEVTNTLRRWRATMTFPATGGGWATAKPWEAFSAGCVCFKHPGYDDQNHIYSRVHMAEDLRQFLSPPTQRGFEERVQLLTTPLMWQRYSTLQFDYLMSSVARLDGGYGAVRDALLTVANEAVRA